MEFFCTTPSIPRTIRTNSHSSAVFVAFNPLELYTKPYKTTIIIILILIIVYYAKTVVMNALKQYKATKMTRETQRGPYRRNKDYTKRQKISTKQTIGHRKVVSLSHLTYFVQLPYLGKLLNLKIRRFRRKKLFLTIKIQCTLKLERTRERCPNWPLDTCDRTVRVTYRPIVFTAETTTFIEYHRQFN